MHSFLFCRNALHADAHNPSTTLLTNHHLHVHHHASCPCPLSCCALQAVSKWCLLVLSALLSDPTIRSWALPWGTALKPLGLGTEETCSALEGMAVLLTIIINRWGRNFWE